MYFIANAMKESKTDIHSQVYVGNPLQEKQKCAFVEGGRKHIKWKECIYYNCIFSYQILRKSDKV